MILKRCEILKFCDGQWLITSGVTPFRTYVDSKYFIFVFRFLFEYQKHFR